MNLPPDGPPDLEIRASCDLLGTIPGGTPVKVLIGFARARQCHECKAPQDTAHVAGCKVWSRHGLGLPQYAGSPRDGYRPLRTPYGTR